MAGSVPWSLAKKLPGITSAYSSQKLLH